MTDQFRLVIVLNERSTSYMWCSCDMRIAEAVVALEDLVSADNLDKVGVGSQQASTEKQGQYYSLLQADCSLQNDENGAIHSTRSVAMVSEEPMYKKLTIRTHHLPLIVGSNVARIGPYWKTVTRMLEIYTAITTVPVVCMVR
jgi:hypothetical protein